MGLHLFLFIFILFIRTHVFILCFFCDALGGVCTWTWFSFLLTHFASSRYPLPFLIFELLFIRDGLLFFPGFRAKRFPWLKFHFFITISMLIIVGAGTREVSTSETTKKWGVGDQNLFAGSNLGELGWFFVSFFLYPLLSWNIDLLAFC